jgi:hypothetical protein
MSSPASLMLDQIKVIALTAMQSVFAGAVVVIGQPMTWSADVLAYTWNDDVIGSEFAGPSVIRDTFYLPLHLMVREGETETTEKLMTDIDWAILGGFRNNRRLNGTANTSWIRQGDGKARASGLFTANNEAYYRNRFYTVEAKYNSTYNYVLG